MPQISHNAVKDMKDAMTVKKDTWEIVLDRSDSAPIIAITFRHFTLDQLTLDQLVKLLSASSHCRLSIVFSPTVFLLSQEKSNTSLYSCHQLSMTSLIAISSLLSPSLETLELSSCKLARQAGIILSQSLQQCSQLRRIVLARNHLRDGGLRAITDMLRSSPVPLQIEEMDISHNGITCAGIGGLGDFAMRKLNASYNSITSIGSLLASNSGLEVLDLSGNALSEVSFRDIASSVVRASPGRLKVLKVCDCGLTRAHVTFFRELLLASSSCSLKELWLGDEPLAGDDGDNNQEAVEWLKSAQDLKKRGEAAIKGLRIEVVGATPTPVITLPPSVKEPPPSSEPATAKSPDKRRRRRPESGGPTSSSSPSAPSRDPSAPSQNKLTDLLPLADGPPEQQRLLVDLAAEPLLTQPFPAGYDDVRAATPTMMTPPPMAIHHRSDLLIAPLHMAMPLRPPMPSSSPPLSSSEPTLDQVASQFTTSARQGPPPLQHLDVEYIVSKTIECMNQNFEHRLAQFLLKMEQQQHEKNATQVQFLAAKVEACERAIPRIEARLDVLADRMATTNAQFVKMQSDLQLHMQQNRQEIASITSGSTFEAHQAEVLVDNRLRSHEQAMQDEFARFRREMSPQSVIEAVSMHLTQFKQEFDANQSSVLRKFTVSHPPCLCRDHEVDAVSPHFFPLWQESIVKDGLRLEDRVNQLETKIGNLESVVQAEQQSSLLALEAISDAFARQ
ncbi:TPA: hypothetical protein N0F65_001596 [Lagenidium giganteum]|uniref:RNI-like protein n=1 Tax=Lagenidium giganteum TaxID=4803 RepID=A0AAV2Z3W0_9STRA|nr:TPA: hypothetical protein N0F65_001596 [Lagenidium giganteum]